MDYPDMANMPTQYLQTPSGLSRQDSHGNESFPHVYSSPFPLTLYPTVPETRDWPPCTARTWDNLIHPTKPEIKQTLIASDLCHSSPAPSLNIISTELQRVLDSLLEQVDWVEVAIKVAKNRAPSVYCNAIEQILLAHIYQLVKAESESDDTAGFVSGNNEKDEAHAYDFDDQDEDEASSEFAAKSEDEDGDDSEDSDDDGRMEEDKDKDDDEDDETDGDGSDEDSDCDGV